MGEKAGRSDGRAAREARLAAALRENLRRRNQQRRDRAAGADEPGTPSDGQLESGDREG